MSAPVTFVCEIPGKDLKDVLRVVALNTGYQILEVSKENNFIKFKLDYIPALKSSEDLQTTFTSLMQQICIESNNGFYLKGHMRVNGSKDLDYDYKEHAKFIEQFHEWINEPVNYAYDTYGTEPF
jgi:hypothetical protein